MTRILYSIIFFLLSFWSVVLETRSIDLHVMTLGKSMASVHL